MILSRRAFVVGLISAPAVVRIASLMPVRQQPVYAHALWVDAASFADLKLHGWGEADLLRCPSLSREFLFNVLDFDPTYVRRYAAALEETNLRDWESSWRG
jgi:hypothetical protein